MRVNTGMPSWCSALPALPAILLLAASFIYAQSGGAISGRVISEDGTGLPNVTVSLGTVSGTRSGQPRTTLTDEEGRFRFTELPYARYTIFPQSFGGYVPPIPEPGMLAEYVPGDNVTLVMTRGGVITGRVTNSNGEPVVGIQISAVRVRSESGARIRVTGPAGPRFTDDRGIYRLYGLQPGTYVVAANMGQRNNFTNTPFDGETPTFHPSSTRDTAAEVTVSSGSEIGGIDIRYRGEAGRRLSGRFVTADGRPVGPGAMAYLLYPGVGIPAGMSLSPRPGDGFEIQGVNDGEYDLIGAQGFFGKESGYLSIPRKVTVRGADVTGLEIRLARMGTIEGKLQVVEDKPEVCPGIPAWKPESALVSAERDRQGLDQSQQFFISVTPPTPPASDGSFSLTNVLPGRNRMVLRLPEGYFIQSITRSAANPRTKTSDLPGGWIELKSGEKISDIAVAISRGAGSVTGRVVPERDGAALPSRMTVHLIPKEGADDLLRYFEAPLRDDRTFSITNIPPGKYLLVIRAVPDDEPAGWAGPLTALDPKEREKLRREADARPNELDIAPCVGIKVESKK
ncbi:MAG: collagen binding domain-containing protein [Blastocatellales bacterium]